MEDVRSGVAVQGQNVRQVPSASLVILGRLDFVPTSRHWVLADWEARHGAFHLFRYAKLNTSIYILNLPAQVFYPV